MELKDLESQEQVVLAALAAFVVLADGVVSENEAGELDAVIAELGEEAWQRSLDAARAGVKNLDDLKALVDTVIRPEARDLIYGTVVDLAIPDSIDPREGKLLDHLEQAWQIQTRTMNPEP